MAKSNAKASPQKAATSKSKLTKTQCDEYLCKVPETKVFWCKDGRVFRDMLDLISGFDVMSDETFWYHANEQKNDFVCWINDVIGDVDLGKQLKKAKTRQKAKEVVQMRYYDLTRLEG